MSRPRSRSSRSSTTSFSGRSYVPNGLGGIAEYEYDAAAAYGEPALSDSSSDEQMARAISESKRAAYVDTQRRSPAVSRAYSYASMSSSSSSSSTLLGSDSPRSASSSSRSSSISYPHSNEPFATLTYYSPTPTPRYAADEVIARNLARAWDVASVQSDIIADPQYTRTGTGPPLVVRTSSPSNASIISYVPQRTHSPTPSRPLSPLMLPTRLRTPSVRSMASNSSVRSAASSARSVSTGSASTARSSSSRASTSTSASKKSILSSVTRSARHAPLHTAAQALRASLPPSLALSVASSSASARLTTPRGSSKGTSRASSIRSVSTATSSLRTTTPETETAALAHLHSLATSPVRCTNPGCGTLIPPAAFDSITFPVSTAPSTFTNANTLNANASPSAGSPSPGTNNTAHGPLPRALLAALHARCPMCTTSHCRGCGLATGCDDVRVCEGVSPMAGSLALVHVPYPSPSHSHRSSNSSHRPPRPCPIPTHCPASRALGLLAALLAFDRAQQAQAHTLTPSRAADKPLLGPLHALIFFLSPSARAVTPPNSGLLMQRDAEDEAEGEQEAPEAHPAFPALFALSRVPAYAAGLLRAGAGGAAGVDVGTWMARGPAYDGVLRVLRAVGDVREGRGMLLRPLASGASLEGWFRSPNSKSKPVLRNIPQPTETESLLTLIRRLEPARAALLRLASASSFGPTVERAHALCDGVLYLLLWDLLEG